MKKLLLILGFWLACLVPTKVLAEDKPLALDMQGCISFATNASFMMEYQQQNKKASGVQLYKELFSEEFLKNTDPEVVEMMQALAAVIVKDTKKATSEQVAEQAMKFCIANAGNVQIMKEMLKKYAGETDI